MGFLESLGKAVGDQIDIEGIANGVWDKIWPWAQKKLDETVDKYTPIIIERLMAAMPIIVATAVKEALSKALEADPDIPGVSDVFDLSETIRKTINDNQAIPIHIPILSDIMNLGRR